MLSITSEQAKALEVMPGSRLSPHLELCCLRQSALVSYENASKEVQVQTGRTVSARTQQRLVQRHVQSHMLPYRIVFWIGIVQMAVMYVPLNHVHLVCAHQP